jgi:hypothetical protein
MIRLGDTHKLHVTATKADALLRPQSHTQKGYMAADVAVGGSGQWRLDVR